MRGLRILDPGPLTLVEDRGRPGYAHLGVPRSGWLDPSAATLANRLVGNPEDAAVLECLLGGLSFELLAPMAVAVTGADCAVLLDSRPVPHGAAVSAAAGRVVTLGQVRRGLRCYVSVAGGIDVEPVLGSRSADTLSGLGPPALAAGAVLPVGKARRGPAAGESVPVVGSTPLLLDVSPGPRRDWFAPGVDALLAEHHWEVQAESDRVALRLAGPALARMRQEELPSEGLVLGAVQVPADGQPLIFLNDHPTTGGYPVIAVVDPAVLGRCAQLRPGDQVSFRWAPARGSSG